LPLPHFARHIEVIAPLLQPIAVGRGTIPLYGNNVTTKKRRKLTTYVTTGKVWHCLLAISSILLELLLT